MDGFTLPHTEILDRLPEAVVSCSTGGSIFYWNSVAGTLFKLTADRNDMQLYTLFPDNAQLLRKTVETVCSTATVQSVDVELSCDTKTCIPFEIIISPHVTASGSVTAVTCLFQNMTRLKKNETLLKDSEERFQLMYDRAPLAYHSCDSDGRILRVNRGWTELLGYERNEVIGKWLGDFMAPEDRNAFIEQFEEFKKTGKTHSEGYMIRNDESQRYISSEGRVEYHSDGTFKQTHCILKDETDRKKIDDALIESESHFRQLFENMSSGVAVYESVDNGEDFIFADLNVAGEQFSNVKKSDIQGKRITEVFPAVCNIGLLDSLKKCLISGKPQYLPLRRYKDNRITQWVENRIFSLPSGRVVAMYNDQTEQRKLEDRLKQAEKMEAIGQLASGVAHDFNNILGGIIGYADMSLNEVPESSRLSRNLSRILQASERASHLVKQILSFSRQSINLQTTLFIKPIIKEVTELLRASLPSSIDLKISLCNESQPVMADSTKIHEILMNMCTNAAHAMNHKGTLEITLTEQDFLTDIPGRIGITPPGAYTIMTIKDTGCGMSQEILDRLFEPYFTTKEVGEGTGMGMAVVYGIIKSHHGNISVQSAPGQGSTFMIYLPQSAIHLDMLPESRLDSKKGTESIMLIDDEPMLIEVATDALQDLGYQVSAFEDSLEALRIFTASPESFDLVITDQTMPGITGYDLAKKFLRLRPDLPILLCSGYSNIVDEEKAISDGIAEFIRKPIRVSELSDKVRLTLDSRKL